MRAAQRTGPFLLRLATNRGASLGARRGIHSSQVLYRFEEALPYDRAADGGASHHRVPEKPID